MLSMGFLFIILGGVGAYLLGRTGHTYLMVCAIICVIGDFWSWGIMHNYATERAKQRSDYKGGFYDFRQDEVEDVPDWITMVNMVFSLASLVLLIVGVVFTLTA